MAKSTDTARLVVSVHPASDPNNFPEVELEGTRAGLVWLAERLLEVAHADQELHTHLDPESDRPVYVSPGGWWLTISRNDRLRRAKKP